MKKLLIAVDYQNDFVTGALANKAAEALEQGIRSKVEQVLADGGYVLFTLDTHDEDYMSTREGGMLGIPHCIRGTYGWELYGALGRYQNIQAPRVALMEKETFGAPNIKQAVMELCGTEPTQIELVGVATDICVISNAVLLHSFFPRADITVCAELCAATTQDMQEKTVAVLHGLGM